MLKQFQNNLLGSRVGLAKLGGWVILAVVLLALPSFSSRFMISMLNNTLITIIAVMGLNLLTGYTGLLSMGNAAFMGIGGFITGIIASQVGLPFWLSLIIGGLCAMLVGVLIGIPALRLKGLYLLLTTLALHFIVAFAMLFYELRTNRLSGIRFPRMQIGDFVFDTQAKAYYLFLAITILVIIFVKNLLRTALGRSFLATRDNESAAKAMGVNIVHSKLVSFAISSFLIGIAGGLMGFNVRNVTAEIYTINLTIDQTVALFLGGQATILGPVYGTAFITLLPDVIGFLAKFLTGISPSVGHALETYRFEIQNIIYGLAIVLVLVFKPGGLDSIIKDSSNFFRKLIKKKYPTEGGEAIARDK